LGKSRGSIHRRPSKSSTRRSRSLTKRRAGSIQSNWARAPSGWSSTLTSKDLRSNNSSLIPRGWAE